MRLSCAILVLFVLSFAAAKQQAARSPKGPSRPHDRAPSEAKLPANAAAVHDSTTPKPALLAQKALRDRDATTCVQINVKKTNTGAESFYRVGAAGAQFIDNSTIIAPILTTEGNTGIDFGLLNTFSYTIDLFNDDLWYNDEGGSNTLSYYNGYQAACNSSVCGDYQYSITPATACPQIPATCYAFNTDFESNILQSTTVNFFIEYYQTSGTVVCLDFTKPFGFSTFSSTETGLQYFWYDGSSMRTYVSGKSSWEVMYNEARFVYCDDSLHCVSFIPV